ncbi:MAG: hypothetical protein GY855_02875 [candidate division Zixibacteria bacterium]|nr:hypothetical protein [candidate division Zixibacteria bacterium]
MNRILFYLLSIIVSLSGILGNAQNLFRSPESAIFDEAHNRYLVGNWNGGDIIQVDFEGNQSYFNTDLYSVAGLHIVGNKLYACSNGGVYNGLVSINLETGSIISTIVFPDKDIINGVTSDIYGYLYVTDMDDGGPGGNKIYQVNIADETWTICVPNIPIPNGIEFDEANNRLIVIGNNPSNGRIFSVSMSDFSYELIAYVGSASGDGIARDNQGYWYFSDWIYDYVFRYSPDFSSGPEVIATGFNNPADINFNLRDNILVIPEFGGNSLSLVTFSDIDEDGVIDINDNCLNTINPDQYDSDGDDVGDLCDICFEGDDNIDTDGDGIPDDCDLCPGFDDAIDFDEDTIADACDNCPDHYNPEQVDTNGNDIGDLCDYICGDIDGKPGINILDVVFMINYKYKFGTEPDPLESADVNHDLAINILDIVYLINGLYKDGPEPECIVWI